MLLLFAIRNCCIHQVLKKLVLLQLASRLALNCQRTDCKVLKNDWYLFPGCDRYCHHSSIPIFALPVLPTKKRQGSMCFACYRFYSIIQTKPLPLFGRGFTLTGFYCLMSFTFSLIDLPVISRKYTPGL